MRAALQSLTRRAVWRYLLAGAALMAALVGAAVSVLIL